MQVKTVREIVGSNMVRYNVLDKLIPIVYKDSNADSINIFIDLYPIYRTLFSNNYKVVVEDKMDLASGIINLCAHYRWFFFRNYGVESTIYLISGLNCPKINNNMIANYNRSTMVRFTGGSSVIMKDVLKSAVNVLQIICPYLNDIHFVKTSYETSVTMLGIIDYLNKKYPGNNVPNLVISKDAYPLQLPLIDKSITFLRPKKSYTGDISYIIMNPEIQQSTDFFWYTYYVDRNAGKMSIAISPYNSTLLSALSGMKQRSILALVNVTKATSMIADLVGDKHIQCSVDTLYEANLKYFTKKNITKDAITARYHALDARFQFEAFYANSVEAKTYNFENKFDPQALSLINSEYFQNNPIEFGRL